jgi:hypothetical protein
MEYVGCYAGCHALETRELPGPSTKAIEITRPEPSERRASHAELGAVAERSLV